MGSDNVWNTSMHELCGKRNAPSHSSWCVHAAPDDQARVWRAPAPIGLCHGERQYALMRTQSARCMYMHMHASSAS
jgi:hypothetical protein